MFVYIVIFILGICIGSFLNCVVWRLHQKKTILGRSICPKCKQKICWYDNIPFLSFVLLKGKCRHCRKRISWQYPVVELITGILFVLVIFNIKYSILNIKYSVLVFRDLLFISILLVIFVYDLRWYLILDKVTIPAMIVALAINLWLGFGWLNLLLAAVIGGGFFLLQYLISKGKWIGGGDIRLGALMGLMLGYPQIIVALVIAYFSGAIIGIGLLLTGKKRWSSQIPFGTFLSAATIVTLLWGEEILDWYLSLII